MHTGFWWRNPRERDQLKDSGVDGRILLKSIFEKWDGMDWVDLAQDRDMGAGFCECCSEPSGFIKCGEFPD
jgi:hypothetical protein